MQAMDMENIQVRRTQIYDCIVEQKIGMDFLNQSVYLVSDKFRQYKIIRVERVHDPAAIREHVTPLLVFQSASECRYINPVSDFTILRGATHVIVTTPLVSKTLYSVIKDPAATLTLRLALSLNIAEGMLYMHVRRRFAIGYLRPQSIMIHKQQAPAASNLQPKLIQQSITSYAEISSYFLTDDEEWQIQLNYYDAPEFYKQIAGIDKTQTIFQKPRFSDKSDIWALGLVFVQLFGGERIKKILENQCPAVILKKIYEQDQLIQQNPSEQPIEQPIEEEFLQEPNGQEQNVDGVKKQNKQLQQKRQELLAQFYQKLLNNIANSELKELIGHMISYVPEKRPTITFIFKQLSKLQTVQVHEKTMFYASPNTKFGRQKNPNQQQANPQHDENASNLQTGNIGTQTLRFGENGTQNIPQNIGQQGRNIQDLIDVSYLINSKQRIVHIDEQHNNPMFKSYFQDCKNRLIADQNFTPPTIKKRIQMSEIIFDKYLRVNHNVEIERWNIDKLMSIKDDKQVTNINGKVEINGSGMKNQNEERGMRLKTEKWKKFKLFQHNIFEDMEKEETASEWELEARKHPNLCLKTQEIPQTPWIQNYNNNLFNYQYLGVLMHERQLQLATAVHTPTPTVEYEQLYILNLKFRGLTSIPNQFICKYRNLKCLYLSHNQLWSIKNIHISCPLLQVIDVQHNCLHKIDEKLWKLKELEQVFFGHNQIECIQGFCLQQVSEQMGRITSCEKLERIYLNNNLISNINGVQYLPALKVICLGKNPIKRVNLNNSKMIMWLKDRNVRVIL